MESKYNDVNFATTPLQSPAGIYPTSATGSFILLNGIAQGTAATERIGQKIKLKSIEANISIQPNVLATTTAFQYMPRTVRVICFVDFQPNGAAITISDLLEEPDNQFSGKAMKNRDRIRILFDEKTPVSALLFDSVTENQTFGLGSNGNAACFKKYLKFSEKTGVQLWSTYSANSAAISSITSGALWLCVLDTNTQNAGATSNTLVYGNTRLRFLDP